MRIAKGTVKYQIFERLSDISLISRAALYDEKFDKDDVLDKDEVLSEVISLAVEAVRLLDGFIEAPKTKREQLDKLFEARRRIARNTAKKIMDLLPGKTILLRGETGKEFLEVLIVWAIEDELYRNDQEE